MNDQDQDLPQVLSIDPHGAREIDDAIGVTRLADGSWKVDVCIPDVPGMMPRGSKADEEARAQGLTRYLAEGRVHRMLPPALVDRLSLSPDEDRPMVHVAIQIGRRLETRVVGVRRLVHRTLAQLSYGQADAAIRDEGHPLHEHVGAVWQLAQILHEERAAATGATFDIAAGTYTNEEGHTVRLERGAAHPSNMAVMEIMILTNAALATWSRESGRSVLYRNHRLPGFTSGSRSAAAEELAEREGLGQATAVRRLRAIGNGIGPAEMGTEPLGHHGLDLAAYAWFTSPLRRYCDVVNLRALLDGDVDEELIRLADHLTTVHRTEKSRSSEHHANVARRRIVNMIEAGEEESLDRYDLHTIVRALCENPGFDMAPALRLVAARLAADGLSGRDIATLEDEVAQLFGAEAHETLAAWIEESEARKLMLAEFRGAAPATAPADGRNHKGRLQEHATTMKAGLRFDSPVRTGPPHNPLFSVTATWSLGGKATTGRGTSRTVRGAEAAAALDLTGQLGLATAAEPVGAPETQARATPGTNAAVPAKSRLMEWVQGHPGSTVVFGQPVSSGPPHAPLFGVQATYRHHGREVYAEGEGRTKKEAEHAASEEMLKLISTT